MHTRVRAVYRQGTFVPHEPCPFPDESEVDLIVEGLTVHPPTVTDPEARRRILEQVIHSMQHNPIPPHASRFRREELHERR